MALSVHDLFNVLPHFPAAIAELLDNAIDEVIIKGVFFFTIHVYRKKPRYNMNAKYCYFCCIFSLRWIMGRHLSVSINLQTHGMITPHCWFKVAMFIILICLFCTNCYLDFNLVLFLIDKMMEGGWILRHWDVAWALDFRISSLTLLLGNVCLVSFLLFPCETCFVSPTIEFILLVSDGNGFKTSTMRLGADVIVFTQNQNNWYFLCIHLGSFRFDIKLG